MSGWLLLSYMSVGSLAGLLGLRFLFGADSADTAGTVWLILQLLPLLVTLPGLTRGHVLSIFFLCLASMLYFIHGVVTFTDTPVWFGPAEIAAAVLLCGSTAMLVRKLREADPARWGKD